MSWKSSDINAQNQIGKLHPNIGTWQAQLCFLPLILPYSLVKNALTTSTFWQHHPSGSSMILADIIMHMASYYMLGRVEGPFLHYWKWRNGDSTRGMQRQCMHILGLGTVSVGLSRIVIEPFWWVTVCVCIDCRCLWTPFSFAYKAWPLWLKTLLWIYSYSDPGFYVEVSLWYHTGRNKYLCKN